MVNTDNLPNDIIPSASYPAILIGGPPHAGKSVLTYNLTRELRRLKIPHFVFRASTDGEGDWYMSSEFESALLEIRDQIRDQIHKQNKIGWFGTFSETICPILANRQLPLIVDLGGKPKDADTCIFQACTHSILLLRDNKPEDTETWHHYTTKNELEPIAELRSQLSEQGGKHIPPTKEPILTGTIVDLLYKERMRSRMGDRVFKELFDRVVSIFSKYTQEQIETSHCNLALIQPAINLEHEPYRVAPDPDKWQSGDLQDLLALVSSQTAIAAYGRAPNWVYTALAMHAYPEPFHQFDACLGWVTPQPLQILHSSDTTTTFYEQAQDDTAKIVEIKAKPENNSFVVRVRPIYYYLNYHTTYQLAFPEQPANMGVIISGKIPFWLFTSIARFYADRNVPWIAVNDASSNEPVVVYSCVDSHPIGRTLPKLT